MRLSIPFFGRKVKGQAPQGRAMRNDLMWQVNLQSQMSMLPQGGWLPDNLYSTIAAYRLVSSVFRCVQVIVNSVIVPLELQNSAGRPLSEDDAAVQTFLRWQREPCPGLDWYHWLARVVGNILISGGCRLVQLTPGGTALLPVPLEQCPPKDADTFPPREYIWQDKTLPADRVVSILLPDPVGLTDATSPLEVSFPAAQVVYQAGLHQRNSLLTGAIIPALMILEREFASPEQFQEVLLKFREMFSRARNSGTFPILDANFAGRIEKLGLTPADMKLLEVLDASERQIARAFGVPPALLGDTESRYSNFREQRMTFIEDTLRPMWLMLESAFNLHLPRILGAEFRVRFRREESFIIQQFWLDTVERLSNIGGKVLTINEVRQRLNYPAIAGGDFLAIPISVLQLPAEPVAPGGDDSEAARQFRAALADFLRHGRQRRAGATPEYRRGMWRVFDTMLGDYRAEDGSGRGLMLKYGRMYAGFLSALQKALIDSARQHWEAERRLPYDAEMVRRNEVELRMRVLPAVYREGMRYAQQALQDLRGHALERQADLTPEVMKIIRRRAEHWADLTSDLTFSEIKGILVKAVQEQWSLQQMIDALTQAAWLSPARAERVARTEVLGALNEGELLACRQYAEEQGVRLRKEWLATQDDRVRDGHLEADGQVVDLDEPFQVGGELLQFPGDPAGSPGNIVNCRCTMLPA